MSQPHIAFANRPSNDAVSVSLFLTDHLWLIENSPKHNGSQVFHPSVMSIFERYLPRGRFEIYFDTKNKPRILCDEQSFYFNLSHSKNMLVLLLSTSGDVGVDVEFVKQRVHQQKISGRYFGHDDNALDLVDFYRQWTAREAFVKAVGCGIDKNFATIQMSKRESEVLIGFHNQFSHRVASLFVDNQYFIAICRKERTDKEIVYFRKSLN